MNGFLLGLLLAAFMTIAAVAYPAIKDILPSIFNQSPSSPTIPTTTPSTIDIENSNTIANETENETYYTSTIPISNTPSTNILSTTTLSTTPNDKGDDDTPKNTTPTDKENEEEESNISSDENICWVEKEIEEIEYYPKCDSSYNSIVDALKSVGAEDTSFAFRKTIAELNGISDYTQGNSGTNNPILLDLLKEGKLIKSKTKKITTIKQNCESEEISNTTDSTIITTIINPQSVKELVTGLLRYEEGDNHGKPCTPYNDSLGYATIGIGRLCNGKKNFMKTKEQVKQECADLAKQCTDESVAEQWLSEDIDKFISCIETTSNIKDAYDKASDKRKSIIISMAYQLGCEGLSKFVKTLKLMAEEKWVDASVEMLDSKWAKSDSPKRASRHSKVIQYDDCLDFCSYYRWN